MKEASSNASSSRPAKTVLALVVATLWLGGATPSASGSVLDVQLVGLPFLYEALFAVANCRNVALDQTAFAKAARLYHLSPDDLTANGRFAGAVSDLDAAYRVRLGDDHDAFCSVSRLSFAVPYGILTDLGPAVPRFAFPIEP